MIIDVDSLGHFWVISESGLQRLLYVRLWRIHNFLLSLDFTLVLDASFAEMSETFPILQAIVLAFVFFQAVLSSNLDFFLLSAGFFQLLFDLRFVGSHTQMGILDDGRFFQSLVQSDQCHIIVFTVYTTKEEFCFKPELSIFVQINFKL